MANKEDPRLSDREKSVVHALHLAAASERAPARLRERIEAQPIRRRPAGAIPALSVGVVTLATIVAIAVVLIIPGGAPGGPSISAAAALAARGSTSPAPATDPLVAYQLTARVGSLHFPNWEQGEGWIAVGSRSDRLGDRRVTTVYYRQNHQTIAYSIVSAPALSESGSNTFMLHGRTVFTWWERGHTCLLSGAGVGVATLENLARAGGARLS